MDENGVVGRKRKMCIRERLYRVCDSSPRCSRANDYDPFVAVSGALRARFEQDAWTHSTVAADEEVYAGLAQAIEHNGSFCAEGSILRNDGIVKGRTRVGFGVEDIDGIDGGSVYL